MCCECPRAHFPDFSQTLVESSGGDWDTLAVFCFAQAEAAPRPREKSTGERLASWPPFNDPLNVYINEALLPALAGPAQGPRLILR